MSTILKPSYSDIRDLSHKTSLVLGYSFGIRNQDGTVKDISGNGHKGTIVGALDAQGLRGRALQFNRTTDYVDIDTVIADLAATTQGTLSAWIRTDDITQTQEIISFGDTNDDTRIQFDINTGGYLRALVGEAGDTKWALDTDAIVLANGIRTHVALVQNGTEPVLYVNGEAVAQTFSTSTDKTYWFSNLGGLDNGRIGYGNWNGAGNATFFGGAIDEPRISDEALSADEMAAEYNDGASQVAFYFNARDEQLGSLPPKGWTSQSNKVVIADDADGRYVGASDNDIIVCKGVDLNYLENSGQIKSISGDPTVVGYAGNRLQIPVKTGQKLRSLAIITGKRTFEVVNGLITPLGLDNVKYFWRGDYGIGLVGGEVDTWEDMIKGWVASAPAPENRMAMTTLGGQLAIQGDGTADYLQTTAFTTPLSQPFTIWCVATIASDNDATRMYLSDIVVVRNLKHNYAVGADCYGMIWGNPASSNGSALPAVGTPVYHLFITNETGTTDNLYANGVNVISVDCGADAFTGLTIGAYYTGQLHSDSKIAEIGICLGAMSAAQKALLAAYITRRYGIVVA